jgi:predicted dehydrogenase
MPSDPCRIGVVGAGHWGPHLIRNFQTSGRSRVVCVADCDERRLARIAAVHPGVVCTTQPGELLDRRDIDAVVIATPTATHYALAKAALERGLHVFVEKPLTRSVAEAEDLAHEAATRRRLLFVGHVFLFNDAVHAVKKRIAAGHLGNIHYLHSLRTNLGPIRTDVSALWDLAAHDVSLFQYLLESPPVAVTGKGGSYINPGIEDVVFATLRYASGVLAHLHATWLSPQKIRLLTIVGDHRMMVFNDMDLNEPVRIYDKGVQAPEEKPFVDSFAGFRSSIREGDITIPRVSLGEPLRNECEHFLDCLQRGVTCRSGAAEGVTVVRILEGIERSLRNGSAEAHPL